MSRHDEPQNADESSPLLPDSSNDTTNKAPVAEELSLPKLLAVLSSIWVSRITPNHIITKLLGD
jgi:hypothetical protein